MSDIAKYLLGSAATLVFGFLGWLIQWYVQKDKLRLAYDIKSSESSEQGGLVAKTFKIKLINKGNRAISDCKLLISFSQGKISEFKFAHAVLFDEIKKLDQSIEATVSFLNPKESTEVIIHTLSAIELKPPSVLARAMGVTATKEKDFTILPFLIILFVLGTFGYTQYDKNEKDRLPKAQDQIFAILNENGLTEVFPEVMGYSPDDANYKNASYHLLHHFLINRQYPEKYISAMDKFARIDGLSRNSSSTIYYLMAKLEQSVGNKSLSDKYLNESKEAASETYEFLMQQDKYFDVNSLTKSLQNKSKIDTNITSLTK